MIDTRPAASRSSHRWSSYVASIGFSQPTGHRRIALLVRSPALCWALAAGFRVLCDEPAEVSEAEVESDLRPLSDTVPPAIVACPSWTEVEWSTVVEPGVMARGDIGCSANTLVIAGIQSSRSSQMRRSARDNSQGIIQDFENPIVVRGRAAGDLLPCDRGAAQLLDALRAQAIDADVTATESATSTTGTTSTSFQAKYFETNDKTTLASSASTSA